MDFVTPYPVPDAPTKGERTLVGGDELLHSLASTPLPGIKLVGIMPQQPDFSSPKHADCGSVALEIKAAEGERAGQHCVAARRQRFLIAYGVSLLMAGIVLLCAGPGRIGGGARGRGQMIAGLATSVVALLVVALAVLRGALGCSPCSRTGSRGTPTRVAPPSLTTSSASSPLTSSTPSPPPSQHDGSWHSAIFRHWRGAADDPESSTTRKTRISPSRVSPTAPSAPDDTYAPRPPAVGRVTPRRGIGVAHKRNPALTRPPRRPQAGGDITAVALSRVRDEARAAGWKVGRSESSETAGDAAMYKKARTEESSSTLEEGRTRTATACSTSNTLFRSPVCLSSTPVSAVQPEQGL